MRAVWFVAGTAAGAYVTAKVRRAAEALTVEGVHDRLTGWFAGARVLRDEVRAATAERETQLRSRLERGREARAVPRELPAPDRLPTGPPAAVTSETAAAGAGTTDDERDH